MLLSAASQQITVYMLQLEEKEARVLRERERERLPFVAQVCRDSQELRGKMKTLQNYNSHCKHMVAEDRC